MNMFEKYPKLFTLILVHQLRLAPPVSEQKFTGETAPVELTQVEVPIWN